jgi:hypothetical protein
VLVGREPGVDSQLEQSGMNFSANLKKHMTRYCTFAIKANALACLCEDKFIVGGTYRSDRSIVHALINLLIPTLPFKEQNLEM